ncbi:MAG: peptide/nickel transport system substrate-binding protein [Thermomicrobiales bacterium]|nr:peptide/nickel transport system substrate-binding protein [Thermomicrobiales bacterium]
MLTDTKRSVLTAGMSRREFVTRVSALGLAIPGAAMLGAVARPSRGAQAVAEPGGTLTYGFWQPVGSLDPQGSGLQIDASINQCIQDRLVWKKPGDPTYYPGLATSWEASPDFTSYTLKLRNDVKFHDGTPFNAQAVKFTFDRLIDNPSPAIKSGAAVVAIGPYDSSEVIDDSTIKVNFKQPNGTFLNMLTTSWLAPQSPTAVQQYGEDYQDHLAGTGPFMLKEYVHNDHVTLVRNPDYNWAPAIFNHTGPAILDSLVYRLLPEDATRVAALKSGEVDIIDRVAPTDLADLAADSNYKTFAGQTGGVPWTMELNVQKAPTADLNVRKAMMMAYDQAAIVDLLFQGTLEPAYNFLEPTMLGFNADTKNLFKHDVEGAKELLEDAGWTGSGTRQKDGQPLKIGLYIVANFGMDEMSVAFQSQMKEIGMEVEIKSAEAAATFAAVDAGESNANWVFYWWADPAGGLTIFFASDRIGAGNGARYANPDVDKMLAGALATGDDAKRAELYDKVVRQLITDVAALPAFHKKLVLAAKASVDMDSLHTNAEGYPNFYDVGFLK